MFEDNYCHIYSVCPHTTFVEMVIVQHEIILFYINGGPKIHRNITRYINNTKCTTHIPNYEFLEFQNDQEDWMYKRLCSYVGVVPIRYLLPSDELCV